MTRALVIKTYGDPEMCGAIVGGMGISGREPLGKEEIEVVEAEIDRQSIQRHLLRVAVGNDKTDEDYAQMVTKANGDYGYTRRHGRLYDAILGLWAGLWLLIYSAHDYLDAWNREG